MAEDEGEPEDENRFMITSDDDPTREEGFSERLQETLEELDDSTLFLEPGTPDREDVPGLAGSTDVERVGSVDLRDDVDPEEISDAVDRANRMDGTDGVPPVEPVESDRDLPEAPAIEEPDDPGVVADDPDRLADRLEEGLAAPTLADEPVPEDRVRFKIVDSDRTAEVAEELGLDEADADLDEPVVIETADGAALRDADEVDYEALVDGEERAAVARRQVEGTREVGVDAAPDEFVLDGDSDALDVDVPVDEFERGEEEGESSGVGGQE